MARNIQPERPGPRGIIQACPRCGKMAPLLGRDMFAKYKDGVCAMCLAEQMDTLVKGLREMGYQVGRFLNERGVTKPNEVLPRGEALYQALVKASQPPPAGPCPGCHDHQDQPGA